MSTEFDWSQFQEVNQETPSFDWSQFQEADQRKSKFPDSFEEFLHSKPPKGRDIRADVVTSATGIAGLPGDLASIFFGENPLTSKSLREKSFEAFPSLAPQNEQEREWDEGLSTVMGLAAPSAPITAATKLIGKGFSKLGGKLFKSKGRELYQIGKNLGIDEKALAPFRHGKFTQKSLSTIGKLGEEAKEGVRAAQNLASPLYQKLSAEGSKLPLNKIVSRSLVRDFQTIASDIKKSPALVKESKDVINFLEEAANNIKTNPNYTAEGLMDLYREMNKSVNWNSIKQAGKKHLITDAKNSVIKGIYGMSPRIGQQFSDMNKIYGGYEKLLKEVSPIKLIQYASKGGPLGYTAISLLTGKDLESSLKTGFGTYFAKKGLGKISAKLLTDPKWVGLKEKLIKEIKNQSYSNIPKIMQAIKKKSEKETPNEED